MTRELLQRVLEHLYNPFEPENQSRLYRDVEAALASPEPDELVNDTRGADWLTNRAQLHPLTVNLVVRFARALAQKLAAAEKKYGYSDGWTKPDWMDECRKKLLDHVSKGDPRDVAAYCAFLWHHGESTSVASPEPEPVAWPGKMVTTCNACGEPLGNQFNMWVPEGIAYHHYCRPLPSPTSPPEPDGKGWQPIETCPKGQSVLCSDGKNVLQCSTATNYAWHLRFEPTHWLPLPPPPCVRDEVDKSQDVHLTKQEICTNGPVRDEEC